MSKAETDNRVSLAQLARCVPLQPRTYEAGAYVHATQGENYELRADLNSQYPDRRKDAIKRVCVMLFVLLWR